jgi:hypothetical protein
MFEEKISESTLQRLRSVRQALLRLHKRLLEYERETYERAGGRISNPYELLQLVMQDSWFAWLHHLSEFIVQIDELLDADEQPLESVAVALLDQARSLLVPSEAGDEFQRKYFEALQLSPDVVLAHADVVKLLGKGRSEVH